LALVVDIKGVDISLSGSFQGIDDASGLLNCRLKLESTIASSSGKSLQINLDQLHVVSSVVLSLLLCLMREANKVSCKLRFVNMSLGLFDMARVGGVESLFPQSNQ
jgi:anti-anti-sigma regulatory factor